MQLYIVLHKSFLLKYARFQDHRISTNLIALIILLHTLSKINLLYKVFASMAPHQSA